MKLSIYIIITSCLLNLIHAQTTDKEFELLHKSFNSKKSLLYGLNKQDSNYTNDIRLSTEIYSLMDNLYDFMNREHRLNGKGSFEFAGNETTQKSVYRFGAGLSVDQGLYPYELDFSASLQTLLNDGVFVTNESAIDISFDFHPYVPDLEARKRKYETKIEELNSETITTQIEKENNDYLLKKYQDKLKNSQNASGLWLENYIIAKRFSDGYLGIESRYEIGGGFIFSLYSNHLTRNGKNIRDEFLKRPTYQPADYDLIRKLRSLSPVRNYLQLSADDIQTISDSRTRYLIANKKQNSKLRLSLLLGAFYAIEKTMITNTINFNGKDTTITADINPTHRFESVIRAGLVWKPKDKYKLRLYPFLILPIGNLNNIVRAENVTDKRLDYFIYFNSTLDIEIEKRFSLSFYYRYYYDNAPNRIFLKQNDNSYVLLSGEKQKSSFGIGLNFDF